MTVSDPFPDLSERQNSIPKIKVIRTSHTNAFTLVELLVAILVVALLAALVAGLVPEIMTRSKEPLCLSNLRQIHVAISQYANDNNGKWPAPMSHGSQSRFIPVRWTNNGADHYGSSQTNKALDPYIPDLKITMCPMVVQKKLLGPTELQYWYGTQSSNPSRFQQERAGTTDPFPSLAWCTWPNGDRARAGRSPHRGGRAMNVLTWDGSVQSRIYTEWRSSSFP